jgi:hypothetical protein
MRLPDSGGLVNETIVFKHTESASISTGPVPFSVSSATVSIQTPNGTISPGVTVIPGGSSEQQLLQALVSEAAAGVYTVTWTMVDGQGQTVQRTESYFVAWTDLYGQVRSILRRNADVLQNSDIDLAAVRIIIDLTGPGMYQDELPDYNQLIPGDRVPFDNAVALTICATMNPWLPRQEALGDILRIQSAQDMIQFAPSNAPSKKKSNEEMMLEAAFRQLASTQTIGARLRRTQDNARSVHVTGRRRSQVTPFVYGPLGEVMVNPGFLRWTGLYSFGREAIWSWLGK